MIWFSFCKNGKILSNGSIIVHDMPPSEDFVRPEKVKENKLWGIPRNSRSVSRNLGNFINLLRNLRKITTKVSRNLRNKNTKKSVNHFFWLRLDRIKSFNKNSLLGPLMWVIVYSPSVIVSPCCS